MRSALWMLIVSVAVVGCKKNQEPEAAPEAAVEEAPLDPATTVTVKVSDGVTRVKVICKDTGSKGGVAVEGAAKVQVPNVDGDACDLVFMPSEAAWGPVKGGSSLSCIVKDGSVGCKDM